MSGRFLDACLDLVAVAGLACAGRRQDCDAEDGGDHEGDDGDHYAHERSILVRLGINAQSPSAFLSAYCGPGVAGPGGGTPEKPVGLVWFGIASSAGVRTEKAMFCGDRARVREQAVVHALGMLTAVAVR